MDVKILDKNETKIRFLLQDSNPQFANALRRIAMMEIPILAIKFVDFKVNDSVLYNEIIAHRLGLIPLVFNPKDFDLPEKSSSKALTEAKFALHKKGPCTVYSGDLKSANPDVKVLYDNIPIVILDEGQELKLEATAMLGFGKDHARHQASVSWYRYYPSAKLEKPLKNTDEVIKACPKNALKIEGTKASVNIDCDLCKECVKVAKPDNVLHITGDEHNLIFTVETVCGLTPETIITMAIDVLKNKAKEFEKQLGKLK
ncbi:MAG: DNA-directed RNA polymerase subunit D [Candidatus Aenigmarchaeota archaeon]|nr:DNA-directed RNA polymerase subunit D [Candidatus Aenigmarchaeota archaeon]